MTIAQMQHFKDAGVSGIVELVSKSFPLTTRTRVVETRGNLINVPVITEDISGSWRPENVGKPNSGYKSITVPVKMAFLDCSYFLDEQVAKSHPISIDAACATAAESAMRGAMKSLEEAAFHGAGTDGDIFKGLDQSVTNVVDAGGTGDVTDAYIINDAAVSLFVAGGNLFEAGEIQKTQVSDSTGVFWAYSQNLSFYAALCAVNTFGIARVKNISATKKLTDDHIFEAMSKMDASYPPSAIYLSTTGVRHLQIARSQVSITGAPAPIPTEVSLVPVYVSSAIAVL